MKLSELKQKYAAVAKDMRKMHEDAGDTEWKDEQRSQWQSMKSELDSLQDKIDREEALRDADQRFVRDNEEELRGQSQTSEAGQSQGPSVDEQRAAAFDAFVREGMGNMSKEQRAVMREMRAQAAGENDKGGYTVPTTMLNRIHESMQDYGGLASVAQILNTSDGATIEWPVSDGTGEEGELLGENTAASEKDVEFGIQNLGAKKLSSKVIRVSNELLQDSAFDIEGFLASRIGSRIGRAEAKYLVSGTGAGTPQQPKGLATSVTGTVAAAAAASLNWKDITKLIHSIDPAYRRAANFRLGFNDNTLQKITEMEDGQGRPLWLPAVAGLGPSTVLGQSYFIDQGFEDMAASKKFMFAGDFQQFVIRRINYMTLKRLVERYAEFDQTAFLAFHRFDCVLQDTAAIKALTGKAA